MFLSSLPFLCVEWILVVPRFLWCSFYSYHYLCGDNVCLLLENEVLPPGYRWQLCWLLGLSVSVVYGTQNIAWSHISPNPCLPFGKEQVSNENLKFIPYWPELIKSVCSTWSNISYGVQSWILIKCCFKVMSSLWWACQTICFNPIFLIQILT